MKKAFTLFSVMLLVFVFSILAVKIYEAKSITTINIVNQKNYLQGKNHLFFMKEYLNSLGSLSGVHKVSFIDDSFVIKALVEEKVTHFDIKVEVKNQDDNIRVYNNYQMPK